MTVSLPVVKYHQYWWQGGLGSSVSIAADYRLDGRGSNPSGVRFSTHPDQPWGAPSLLYMGTRSFPGVKYGRGMLLTTHLLLVPWSGRVELYLYPPSGPQLGLQRVHFTFLLVTGVIKLITNVRTAVFIYRVIHKSLRDFQTRLRNNRDRHGRKEHINR